MRKSADVKRKLKEKKTVQSAVRGFHVYKAIWRPEEGEKLMCEHKYDLFAVDRWTERLLVIFPLKSRD